VGILVVLLVAAWGLVLGPALLQSVGNSPVDSERVFKRSLSALGRKQRQPVLGGRSILVPPKSPYPLNGPVRFGKAQGVPGAKTAAMRRRRNLTNLAVFIIATFLLGFIPPLHFILFINLIADVALILYLGLALYVAIWPPPERQQEPVVTADAPPAAAVGDGSF